MIKSAYLSKRKIINNYHILALCQNPFYMYQDPNNAVKVSIHYDKYVNIIRKPSKICFFTCTKPPSATNPCTTFEKKSVMSKVEKKTSIITIFWHRAKICFTGWMNMDYFKIPLQGSWNRGLNVISN